MTRRPRELVFGGVVVLFGYNVTRHYQLVSSLYVREILKKLAADIEVKFCFVIIDFVSSISQAKM